ncbi:MAG: ABC transporter ATP-binding protein [Bacteroidales bacterium]|nr:ABC transporter ATP-binding protein [Bacteroidales bacterium]
MSNIAIEFNNVGKQYRLGRVGTGTLSHDLNRWWQTTILRREDPYLKIGETNDRTKKGDSDYVWALRDISFQVEQGDVVGIIGKNGAGKSTLLKLLSHITSPSTGTIRYKGRIASLLEVGTGFHPELTGRENIYMNGSIMGMTKAEITRKLDEIVDFAGVERYLDTPVKRYSSGMTVRLGFAVAAFLEPEILVVDEVLAVGDAEFQKKAIGKMQDVANGQGRTILFVSHNMAAVRSMCKSGIVLKDGMVNYMGTAGSCAEYYVNNNSMGELCSFTQYSKPGKVDVAKEVVFLSVGIENNQTKFNSDDEIPFHIELWANNTVKNCRINTTIFGMDDVPIGGVSSTSTFEVKAGEYIKVRYSLNNHNIVPGTYYASFSVGIGDYTVGQRDFQVVSKSVVFEITRVGSGVEVVQWQKCWGNIMIPYTQEIISRVS